MVDEYNIVNIIERYTLKITGIRFSPNSKIKNFRNLTIGRGSVVQNNCTIQGGESTEFHLYVGTNCIFRNNVYISSRRGIINIGNFCYFAHNDWIGGQGQIEIGDNSIFGPNVVIISSNHDLEFQSGPRFTQPEILGRVCIGRNVWVGANSTILPGATIGENAVIGAGSVVTSDVAPNSLAVGNPAKFVRYLRPGTRSFLVDHDE